MSRTVAGSGTLSTTPWTFSVTLRASENPLLLYPTPWKVTKSLNVPRLLGLKVTLSPVKYCPASRSVKGIKPLNPSL